MHLNLLFEASAFIDNLKVRLYNKEGDIMKQFLSIFLLAVMLFSLTACGSANTSSNNQENNSSIKG